MKIGFLVLVLVGKPFNADCSGEFFFIFKLIFCSYLFVSLLALKKVERNYLFPFECLISL